MVVDVPVVATRKHNGCREASMAKISKICAVLMYVFEPYLFMYPSLFIYTKALTGMNEER